MKFNVFVLLCLCWLLTQCSKKEEPFKSYLLMSIDGVSIECTRSIQANGNHIRYTNLPMQVLSISGGWNTANTKGDIELELYDYKNTTGEWPLNLPGGATMWLDTTASNGLISGGTYEGWGPGNETHYPGSG